MTNDSIRNIIDLSSGRRIGGRALHDDGMVRLRNLREDSPLEFPGLGFNRHYKLMHPDTRAKVLEARRQEIEAFANDRGLDPGIVFGIAEASMRMGKVPDLRLYGIAGDEGKAIKHFVMGSVLDLAGMEDRAVQGQPINETHENYLFDRLVEEHLYEDATTPAWMRAANRLLQKAEEEDEPESEFQLRFSNGYRAYLEAARRGDVVEASRLCQHTQLAKGACTARAHLVNTASRLEGVNYLGEATASMALVKVKVNPEYDELFSDVMNGPAARRLGIRLADFKPGRPAIFSYEVEDEGQESWKAKGRAGQRRYQSSTRTARGFIEATAKKFRAKVVDWGGLDESAMEESAKGLRYRAVFKDKMIEADSEAAFLKKLKPLGIEKVGVHKHRGLAGSAIPEGVPKFRGLMGPFKGHPGYVRYESAKAYKMFSEDRDGDLDEATSTGGVAGVLDVGQSAFPRRPEYMGADWSTWEGLKETRKQIRDRKLMQFGPGYTNLPDTIEPFDPEFGS